jgi:hypothetical protein
MSGVTAKATSRLKPAIKTQAIKPPGLPEFSGVGPEVTLMVSPLFSKSVLFRKTVPATPASGMHSINSSF